MSVFNGLVHYGGGIEIPSKLYSRFIKYEEFLINPINEEFFVKEVLLNGASSDYYYECPFGLFIKVSRFPMESKFISHKITTDVLEYTLYIRNDKFLFLSFEYENVYICITIPDDESRIQVIEHAPEELANIAAVDLSDLSHNSEGLRILTSNVLKIIDNLNR